MSTEQKQQHLQRAELLSKGVDATSVNSMIGKLPELDILNGEVVADPEIWGPLVGQ